MKARVRARVRVMVGAVVDILHPHKLHGGGGVCGGVRVS